MLRGGLGDIFSSTFHLLSFSIMWHEYTLSHNFHCFSVNSKISQSFKKCPSQFPAKTISQPIPRFPSHVPVSSKIPQSFLTRFQNFPVRSKQSQSFPSLNISLSFPSEIHFPVISQPNPFPQSFPNQNPFPVIYKQKHFAVISKMSRHL